MVQIPGVLPQTFGYGINDWIWSIHKFERKLSNWTYKLLSLGGILVLVKSVLMGLAVYWLSLAWMPSTILTYIKCYIFKFVWGNTTRDHKYHLVDWLTISRPYELGGWNIKNIEWFSLALCSKSLWLVLNGDGFWSQIIKHKYLKNLPVDVWIRQQYFSVQGTSHMWNGFIIAISWITICLGWKTGNG